MCLKSMYIHSNYDVFLFFTVLRKSTFLVYFCYKFVIKLKYFMVGMKVFQSTVYKAQALQFSLEGAQIIWSAEIKF